MSTEKPNKKLFEDFAPVSTDTWEEQIVKDLKGADYNKKLVGKTLDGIQINPYYRSDDLFQLDYLNANPNEIPFTRGNKINDNNWEIRQDIIVDDIHESNKKALFILNRGINSVGFDIPVNKTLSVDDLSRLLKDIHIDCIGIQFVAQNQHLSLLNNLIDVARSKITDLKNLNGSLNFDILGNLSATGNYYLNEEEDLKQLTSILNKTINELPGFRVLAIHGCHYRNAGATAVQELGFAIAILSDYLNYVTDNNISPEEIVPHIQYNLGIGENYFLEIAKIRALRYLISQMYKAYDIQNPQKAFIHSVTTGWNKTIYDPYVNILRTTTEAMAAIIGGTDSLAVKPFDYSYKKTSRFSGRISRNIQLVLKDEAYLDKIVDPSAGSYYIENLTHSIIEQAWDLFLTIEDKGGFKETLKTGFIQNMIKETVNKRKKLIGSRKEILLGTNQYPNANEKISTEIDSRIAFPEPVKEVETVIEPIRFWRASIDLEKLRMATEQSNRKIPSVYLLNHGNVVMSKARAGFASNFFACGGYEIIHSPVFDNISLAVENALKSNAEIIVICSSDEEYKDLVPEIQNYIQNKAILVVAGAPACMDELKEKGIRHFIHIKSDLTETLIQFHKLLGMI